MNVSMKLMAGNGQCRPTSGVGSVAVEVGGDTDNNDNNNIMVVGDDTDNNTGNNDIIAGEAFGTNNECLAAVLSTKDQVLNIKISSIIVF